MIYARHLRRDKLVAELGCLLLHVLELLFPVLLLVFFHVDRLEFHLVLQHPVHYPRNCVRRGHRRLRRSQPGFQTTIHHPEDAVRLLH